MKKKTKICSKCKKSLPATPDYFRKVTNNPDGLDTCCKKCRREYDRKYYKQNREKVRERVRKLPEKIKEKVREYGRKYREENKDKAREYDRKYYKQNREKVRERILKREYNLTPEEYQKLFQSQNGVCAICGQPERLSSKGGLKKLNIDHNHVTGKVRGLLCKRCNTRLGILEDMGFVTKAKLYLEKHEND